MPTQSQKNILKYEEVGIKDVAQVGGKNASLGEMIVTLKIERRAGAIGVCRHAPRHIFIF